MMVPLVLSKPSNSFMKYSIEANSSAVKPSKAFMKYSNEANSSAVEALTKSLTPVEVNNSSSLRVQLVLSKLQSIAFLMISIETSLVSAVKAVQPVLSNLKSIQIWTKIKSNFH